MMLKANDVQQEFVMCNICGEDYDEEFHIPRVLPCLHTYCEVCLRKLSTTSVITCHICKEKSRLPHAGMNTTRRNLREFVKLRTIDSGILCKDCPDDNIASDFCKHCNIYLCLDCKQTHRRSLASRSHVILSIENLKDSGPEVFQRCMKCTKSGHEGQPLTFYGSKEECRTLVCSLCMVRDHTTSKGHVVQNVEDVQQLKMIELTRIFSHLGDVVTLTKTLVEQMEQEILNMDIREFEIEREVDATFAECQRVLEKRKDDLKTEISKVCRRHRAALLSKSETMGSFINRVGNAKDFSSIISSHSDPSEFLILHNVLHRQLRLLAGHNVHTSIDLETASFDTQDVLTQFRALMSTLWTISTETQSRNLRIVRDHTDLSTTSRPSSIRLDAGHTDVICPEIMFDRDTVHKYRAVSDCGRKLHSKPTSKRKTGQPSNPRKQLRTYRGAIGHRSFQQPGKFYFEVVINIDILKDLDNSNFVFEVGLCSLEEVDRGHYLYEQDHAWSLCGQHCERHDMVCRYLGHRGRNLLHTELAFRTAGTKLSVGYGFLFDTELDKLVVYDCQANNKIFTFVDVGSGLELGPVLGCHWPSKVNVTIALRSGRDIALPDVPVARSFSMVI